MENQYLSITITTCTNPNGRNAQCLRNCLCYFFCHQLQYHCKSTCCFKGLSFIHQTFCIFGVLTLNAVAANHIYRLWCKSNMPQHRNSRSYNRSNCLTNFETAFHFDGMSPPFLHQSAHTPQGFIYTSVIGHKWHICHNECFLCAPSYRTSVVDHIVNRNG
ncbi:hypothetical protein D3C76_1284900 [compost metagenome]